MPKTVASDSKTSLVISDSKTSLASAKYPYEEIRKSVRRPLSFILIPPTNPVSRTIKSTTSSTSKLMSAKSKTTSTTTSKRSEKLTKSALERIRKEAYSHLIQQKKYSKKRILTWAIIHIVVILVIIAIILLIVFVYWEQWKSISHTSNYTTVRRLSKCKTIMNIQLIIT